MKTETESYDAILIGGGPSGSCAGAILGEYGHRALILEREKFPRYHIGESLIPFTFGPLERIGMIPKMRKSHFVKKYTSSLGIGRRAYKSLTRVAMRSALDSAMLPAPIRLLKI